VVRFRTRRPEIRSRRLNSYSTAATQAFPQRCCQCALIRKSRSQHHPATPSLSQPPRAIDLLEPRLGCIGPAVAAIGPLRRAGVAFTFRLRSERPPSTRAAPGAGAVSVEEVGKPSTADRLKLRSLAPRVDSHMSPLPIFPRHPTRTWSPGRAQGREEQFASSCADTGVPSWCSSLACSATVTWRKT
jgi:hypothetical protein